MIDMYSHICPNRNKSNSWKNNPGSSRKTVETIWRNFNQFPNWLSEQSKIKLKEECAETKRHRHTIRIAKLSI